MVDYMAENDTEIVLDAGPDADDANRLPEHVDHEYVQNTIKGIERSFMLFDDIYLNYSLKNSNPKMFKIRLFGDRDIAQQNVNLTYLDIDPDRMRYVAWNWFFIAIAAIVLASIIIYVGEYSNFSIAHDAMLPVGILLGAFAVIAFMIFYYKTQDKVIYKSYIGQAPIFELLHKPRNKDYNSFIDKIDQSIYQAHNKKGITMKYILVGELKYVRKISEQGLISNADYEKARSKIFKHKEYQV